MERAIPHWRVAQTFRSARRPAALALAAGLCLLAVAAARSEGTVAGQLRPGALREVATGKVLIASRGLGDPNFVQTVVLLADHNDQGSMGLVINRRSEIPVSSVFPHLARTWKAAIFIGGPVAPTAVLALLRTATPPSDSRHITADLHVITTREPLETLVRQGPGLTHFRLYAGYAGWGAGQLERETVQGAWHVLSADPGIAFDNDPPTLWDREIRRTESRAAD
jgi:putative transcriptional regulator